MSKDVRFAALVHRVMLERGETHRTPLSYVRQLATRIPEDVTAEAAAGMFIRWLYREPFQTFDGVLVAMLPGSN